MDILIGLFDLFAHKMSLLQVFFVVSGIIVLILSIEIARKQKFNALHFLVFLGIWSGLLIFSFFPSVLDLLGKVFGTQRGADVLVYSGIVFLSYFSILMLNKVEENREDVTRLVREIALLRHEQNSSKGTQNDAATERSLPTNKSLKTKK